MDNCIALLTLSLRCPRRQLLSIHFCMHAQSRSLSTSSPNQTGRYPRLEPLLRARAWPQVSPPVRLVSQQLNSSAPSNNSKNYKTIKSLDRTLTGGPMSRVQSAAVHVPHNEDDRGEKSVDAAKKKRDLVTVELL